MKRVILWSLLAFAAAGGLNAAAKIKNKGNFGVSGWLLYWAPESMSSFEKNAALIDRVYPEWYLVGPEGLPLSVADNDPRLQRADFEAKKRRTVEISRKNGIQVLYSITNFDIAIQEHSAARVHKFLYDPELRKKHIEILVANAVRDGADGIDIDYENLKAADASPFAGFMTELRSECDKKNLILAAALTPKFDASGSWEGNQAHDYAALAPSLQLIHPMTFDEHWGSSHAGPVSSPEFTEWVDRYALQVAGPDKLEMGLAAYGYDWKEKKGTLLTYSELKALLAKKRVVLKRDPESAELNGHYGEGREIWFCDAASYLPKYELLKKLGLAGIAIWRLGSEDPAFWEDLKKMKFSENWSEKAPD